THTAKLAEALAKGKENTMQMISQRSIGRVLVRGTLTLVGVFVLMGMSGCIPVDEQEPNNTADQALAQTHEIGRDVAIVQGETGYKDQTLCCPDVDYWRFTGSGTRIKIVVYPPESNGCYDIDFGRYSETAAGHFEPAWYNKSAGIIWYDHTCNITGFVSQPRTYTFDSSYNMVRLRPAARYRLDVSFF